MQAHRQLKYLFQPVLTHSALQYPWYLKSKSDTVDSIPELLPQISRVHGSTRHEGFTLNVHARMPPPWTYTAQRLLFHCLVHRIILQVTNDHTKVPIPKPGATFTSGPITLNYNWEAFLTGWISDLAMRCGNKQGSSFVYLCSNAVASFKSNLFFYRHNYNITY